MARMTNAEKQRAYRERKAKREGRPVPPRRPRSPRLEIVPKPEDAPPAVDSQPAAGGAAPSDDPEENVNTLADRTVSEAVRLGKTIPLEQAVRIVAARGKAPAGSAAGRATRRTPAGPTAAPGNTR